MFGFTLIIKTSISNFRLQTCNLFVRRLGYRNSGEIALTGTSGELTGKGE